MHCVIFVWPFVNLKSQKILASALYKGLAITAIASIILIYFVTDIFIGIDKLIINKDLLIESFSE